MPEEQLTLADGAVDPNVRVPAAVARAAARSAEIIQQMQQQPQPEPDPAPEPVADPPITAAVTPPPPEPAQTPPVAAPAPTPPADENDQSWKQRYHSMEGRFKQSMSTITQMQDTMRQMGDEMTRLQDFVRNNGNVAVTPQGQHVPKLVTQQDREVYGDELLDVVQRAAREVVAPELAAIQQENRNLRQSVDQSRKSEVHRALDGDVPRWREINRSQRFKEWLSLTDLLAGTARGRLLNDAFKAADAPRVVAFFKSFVADEATTGSTEFAPTASVQPQVAPRTPAVALEALAAPGRAKPAAATGQPADKPVFTRAQISKFYDDCRRQLYAGREPERAAYETAIFAAQKEGRVRG